MKKVSFYYLIIVALASSAATFFITHNVMSKSYSRMKETENKSSDECGFQIRRLNEDSLVKPILFVENSCEAENLQLLKQNIIEVISNYTNNGTLTSASVYLRDMLKSQWISINGSEYYNPGSLLKVPEMIAYLKMNEEHPGLLDKKITYDQKYNSERKPVFVTKSIQYGQTYTVRELLKYMIEYSDNAAAFLLLRNIDVPVYTQIYEDLGLRIPNKNSSTYPMNTTEYTKFMRSLFNASYLNNEDSEFAIGLLTNSDFSDGITQGIPKNIEVAHKFGEEGNLDGFELHESAIVYLKNSPYVLTIMTKGHDFKKQCKVLSDISNTIYQSLSSR